MKSNFIFRRVGHGDLFNTKRADPFQDKAFHQGRKTYVDFTNRSSKELEQILNNQPQELRAKNQEWTTTEILKNDNSPIFQGKAYIFPQTKLTTEQIQSQETKQSKKLLTSRFSPTRIENQSVDSKIKLLDQQRHKIQEMREIEKKIRNELTKLEMSYETTKNIVKQSQTQSKDLNTSNEQNLAQKKLPFQDIFTDFQLPTRDSTQNYTERVSQTNMSFKDKSFDEVLKYPDVLIQKRKQINQVPESGIKINQHNFKLEDYDIQRYSKGKNIGYKSTKHLIG